MKQSTILHSHDYIFKTYKELKRILPNGFLKMKVLEKQKYPLNNNSIINEIEKNYNNKNKRNLSSFQNINIFYNDEEKDEKEKKFDKLLPIIKNKSNNNIQNDIINSNNTNKLLNSNNYLNNSGEFITYRNFREKNMKMLGINCDVKLKRNKGLYNSVSISDIDMKKNLYLPRIIDRMKYSLPRNLRNNKGFIILGKNANNILNIYKELNISKQKEDMPTDMFFYSNKKLENNKNKDDLRKQNKKSKTNKEK